MSPDPITALTEQVEKLIIEHASAVMLRDHVALLRDKFSLLEKENAELRQKVSDLEKENTYLRMINKTPKREISHETLPDEQIALLKALFQNDEASLDKIAQIAQLSAQIALFHLTELQINNMVCSNITPLGDPLWFLSREGRRYLIENDLV